jgi:hypothetical protein
MAFPRFEAERFTTGGLQPAGGEGGRIEIALVE